MKYFMIDSIHVQDKRLVQSFYIGYCDGKKTYILNGGEFKEVDDDYTSKPTFFVPVTVLLKDGLGQSMLDFLLSHKIKPTTLIENKEELQALKNHLEDMRKLVFMTQKEK